MYRIKNDRINFDRINFVSTVGAKSISPAKSINPPASAAVLRCTKIFFPKFCFKLPKYKALTVKYLKISLI